MDKELEIMTVDGVDYAILKEVKNVGTTYVLSFNSLFKTKRFSICFSKSLVSL